MSLTWKEKTKYYQLITVKKKAVCDLFVCALCFHNQDKCLSTKSGLEQLQNLLQCVFQNVCMCVVGRLSGCQVTEEGCFALASALESNPASPLKELDLSYNHPGDSGSKRLFAIVEDPKRKLQTLWYVKMAGCV